MSHRKWFGKARATALAVCLALVVPATTAAQEQADREPIVGLWSITVSYGGSVIDNVFSGWTSDGLEFDRHWVADSHWLHLLRNLDQVGRPPLRTYPPVLRLRSRRCHMERDSWHMGWDVGILQLRCNGFGRWQNLHR